MVQSRTFLSYSRRGDAEFALKLARDLRNAGVDVWLDQLDIEAGARWDAAVEAALRSAGQVIVVLSPSAVESQNVLDEVSYAFDEGKRILPVLARECDVPLRLRRLQRLDLTRDYEQGVRRLISVLAPAAEPAEPSVKAGPVYSRPAPAGGKGSTAVRRLAIFMVAVALAAGLFAIWVWWKSPAALKPTDPVGSHPEATKADGSLPKEPPGKSVSAPAAAGSYTDARDGTTYKWAQIGKQVWFTQNQSYRTAKGFFPAEGSKWGHYPDATGQLNASFTQITGAEYIQVYGGLYTWDAASQACPAGWHLPSKSEWEEVIQFHGGAAVAGRRMSVKIAKYSEWKASNQANNDHGLSLVLGGRMEISDRFLTYVGAFATYWSSTEASGTAAVALTIGSYTDEVKLNNKDKRYYGLSVRCVQDRR